MKKTFWHHIIFLGILFVNIENTMAIPAPRRVLPITQPDGTTVNGLLKGDEHFHYAVSTDGYTLLPNDKGFYHYAVIDSAGSLKAGRNRARNIDQRDTADLTFLKTIKPGLSFSAKQIGATRKKQIQKSFLRSARAPSTVQANQYPTTGSPKSLVILVNFSDVKFGSANTAATFSSMLNEENYRNNNHIGSSRDYYKYNSSGKFTPDFVVVGPVTLNKNMDYYGSNDAQDNDLHPALMVKEACELAASKVDFSKFDYDNDGYVDNIYVFYAGKGEADGGGANTIWPHSWGISGENLSLTLNGKKIETYACSGELKGSGYVTGIGTFTHEYGHVLGLVDMYDTDYAVNGQGFDIGDWSLMANGSYNKDGNVPPCLTLLERAMLNWATPIELTSAASITFPELGTTNTGYIINTGNKDEFYLLENRQQKDWDTYLPYHGMLIYHIDMRKDANISFKYSDADQTSSIDYLWSLNMVNAISDHQCADIVEADNIQSLSTSNVKSDPFPGLGNKTYFTDNSKPSMKLWNGMSLNKPITSISEKDGLILFKFMGGVDFSKSPVSLPAKYVKPFQFTVSWASIPKATGYFLDVYTQDLSSGTVLEKYIDGYQNVLIEDTFQIVKVPNDLTQYYYRVRATNNLDITQNSETQSVYTPDGTPLTRPATDIKTFSFTANWDAIDWAKGYYLDLYTLETTPEGDTIKFVDGFENLYVTDNKLAFNDLDDQTTYHYRIRATTGDINSRNSNEITVITPKALSILAYAKNRTIYLKGMDPGSTVRVYDPSGLLLYTSTTNKVAVEKAGIYLAQTKFDGKTRIIKILVK